MTVRTVTARIAALVVPALLLLGVAVIATPAPADAAPYPPGSPCVVSAWRTGPVASDGSAAYSVIGSGLGPSEPVRLVLASRQVLGLTRTDAAGGFTASVRAPRLAAAQPIVAASPQRRCSSSPGTPAPATGTPATGTPTTGTPTTGTPTRTAPTRKSPGVTPRAAEPGGIHGISALLGVIIAAILLVLGTLAVLFFTRRPEH